MDGEPQAAPEKPSDTLENKAIAAFYSGQQSLLALHINQQGDMTMPTAEEEDNKNKEEKEKEEGAQQEEGGEGEGEKDEEKEKEEGAQQEEGGEGEGEKDEEKEKEEEDPEQSSKKLLANLEERVAQLSQENADLKQQLDTANSIVAKLTKGLKTKGGGAPSASNPKTFDDLVKTIDQNLPQQEWRKQYLQLVNDHPQLFEQTYGIPAKRSIPNK